MKVVIKSPLKDLLSFIRHLKKRKKIFRQAPSSFLPMGKMNILAGILHPKQQVLKIHSIIEENSRTSTYRLVPSNGMTIACFRAGQYIAIDCDIEGIQTSRPFSICSSPDESYENNYYDISIKTDDKGFVSPYIQSHWKKGLPVYTSEPLGSFYFEPLRDRQDLVFLAGGSGITPFKSLVGDLLKNNREVNITLFYGMPDPSEKVFHTFFEDMEELYPDRFKVISIYENSPINTTVESGFIRKKLLLKHLDDLSDKSFFICGPQGFQKFVVGELMTLGIMEKHIRQDSFNISNGNTKDTNRISINVINGKDVITLYANPEETILIALERAGFHHPANCRTGECGWCRSKLVSGDISVSGNNDGRRSADRKFGYFHPCSSYAVTDITIVPVENPRKIPCV